MKAQNIKDQFHRWVNSLVRFGKSPNDYILWKSDYFLSDQGSAKEYKGHVIIYTRNYSYSITCRCKNNGTKGYIGCIVSARKPLAGEEHTRGKDLADGPFTLKTWNQIVREMLQYEMVRLAAGIRRENHERMD